jgi:hypothetical protein
MSTTWRRLLTREFGVTGDTWEDVESCTLRAGDLDKPFDAELAEGESFTLWTAKRVYFPGAYDGGQWVVSVSRHPDGIPTDNLYGMFVSSSELQGAVDRYREVVSHKHHKPETLSEKFKRHLRGEY